MAMATSATMAETLHLWDHQRPRTPEEPENDAQSLRFPLFLKRWAIPGGPPNSTLMANKWSTTSPGNVLSRVPMAETLHL